MNDSLHHLLMTRSRLAWDRCRAILPRTRYTVSLSMNKEGFPEIDPPRPFTVADAERSEQDRRAQELDPDAHITDDQAYLKAKQDRFSKGGLSKVDPDKYIEEVRGRYPADDEHPEQ